MFKKVCIILFVILMIIMAGFSEREYDDEILDVGVIEQQESEIITHQFYPIIDIDENEEELLTDNGNFSKKIVRQMINFMVIWFQSNNSQQSQQTNIPKEFPSAQALDQEFNTTTSEQVDIVVDETEYTTYYVSADGNGSGLTINDPMSLAQVNETKFYGGERVLFKCGDTFYGQLSPKMRGDGTNGKLIISCYGDGDLPIFTTSKIVDQAVSWEKYSDGIWRVDLTDTTKFKGYTATDEDACNIGFIKTSDGVVYGGLRTAINDLINTLDFFCDGQYLYLYSQKNPYIEYGNITLATNVDVVLMPSYTDISNIKICDSGANAIKNKVFPIVDTDIHDLIVARIGGALQYGVGSDDSTRHGNGIEVWGTSATKLNTNICIYKNLITDIYDSGISIQGNNGAYSNFNIYDNIILRCCASFEFWTHGSNDTMTDIHIYNNYTISEGGGWGQVYRPSKWMGDYTFGMFASNTSPELIFENNISINPYRIFRFTTTLPAGQQILWENNVVYIGSNTKSYALNVGTHASSLEEAFTLYYSMSTWDVRYCSADQQDILDTSEILWSENFNAINELLKGNMTI